MRSRLPEGSNGLSIGKFLRRVDRARGVDRVLRRGIGRPAAEGQHRPGLGITAKGFDTDLMFMAAEITRDEMHFNAISRLGQIVDSGVLTRRKITP